MSGWVFWPLSVVFCFATSLLLSEKGVGSMMVSYDIANAAMPTILGFYLAKTATRNRQNTLAQLFSLQLLNVVGAYFGLLVAVSSGLLSPAPFTTLFVLAVACPFLYFSRNSHLSTIHKQEQL